MGTSEAGGVEESKQKEQQNKQKQHQRISLKRVKLYPKNGLDLQWLRNSKIELAYVGKLSCSQNLERSFS